VEYSNHLITYAWQQIYEASLAWKAGSRHLWGNRIVETVAETERCNRFIVEAARIFNYWREESEGHGTISTRDRASSQRRDRQSRG